MQREHDGHAILLGDVGKGSEYGMEPLGIVGIVVAVDSGQDVIAGFQP